MTLFVAGGVSGEENDKTVGEPKPCEGGRTEQLRQIENGLFIDHNLSPE